MLDEYLAASTQNHESKRNDFGQGCARRASVAQPSQSDQLYQFSQSFSKKLIALFSALNTGMLTGDSKTILRIVRDIAREMPVPFNNAECDLRGNSRSFHSKYYEQVWLTQRQRQVLELLLNGYSNKEIARSLNLAEGTVKVHMAALFRVLGVTNRASAAVVGTRLLGCRNVEFRQIDDSPPKPIGVERLSAPTQTLSSKSRT